MKEGEWFTPELSLDDVRLRRMTFRQVQEYFGLEVEPERNEILTEYAPPPLEPEPLSRALRLGCAVLAVAFMPFWLISRATGEEVRR